MAVKKYNSRLVFGDSYNSLRINVYATGTYKQKHYKKDRFITFIYDINYPVDVYVGCDNNDTPYELFLYFKTSFLYILNSSSIACFSFLNFLFQKYSKIIHYTQTIWL